MSEDDKVNRKRGQPKAGGFFLAVAILTGVFMGGALFGEPVIGGGVGFIIGIGAAIFVVLIDKKQGGP